MELFGLDRAELVSLCEELGHSSFRGKQLAEWLYKKSARHLGQMSNLPGELRERLSANTTLTRSEVAKRLKSPDGTTKFLLKLGDDQTIESVLLPYPDRMSVCVSTQVGCAAGCVFCATADCGLARNLTAGEIVDQVLTLQDYAATRITHVVFMGMGEPLLNFDNVLKTVHLLNDEVGIGMRRMTISTVGITPRIRQLQEMDLQLTLAISLHASEDSLRRQLIPISDKYPLVELTKACRDYANSTKRRITFEYMLIAGVNDSEAQARHLANLLRKTLCNVNLIPYNRVPGKPFSRPPRDVIARFRSVLEREGIEVTQRMERGHAVSAACGQLKRNREGTQ